MLKRIIKGILALTVGKFAITLSNVILVPLYLHYWTAEFYGEWLVIISSVQYLLTLDLGMQYAAVNKLTQAFNTKNFSHYKEIQDSSFSFYLLITIVSSLVIGALVYFLPVHKLLNLYSIDAKTIKWLIWLLSVQVLISFPASLFVSVYRTTGDLARSEWLFNLKVILIVVFTGITLAIGGDPIHLALSQYIPIFILITIIFFNLKTNYPNLIPGFTKARYKIFVELFKPSLLFLLLTLTNLIVLQGSVLVVSYTSGALAVALFVSTRTLATMIKTLVSSFYSAFWPDITRLDTEHNYSQLRNIHTYLVSGSISLAVALTTILWFEGEKILATWTGNKLIPDPLLIKLLCVYILLQVPWSASCTITKAINKHQKVAKLSFYGSIVGILFAVFLTKYFGYLGVPIGLIIGEAIFCYHLIIQDTCFTLKDNYWKFAGKLWVGGLINFAVTFGIILWINSILEFNFYGKLFLELIIATIISSTLSFALLLNNEQKLWVFTTTKRIINHHNIQKLEVAN
jgi:O-antigen/teichoic acid export membrane protein